MELLNYLFPFKDFVLPLTLHKINNHFYGNEVINIESGKDLYDYLQSPLNTFFYRIESDHYEALNIYYGDVIIVEKNHLRYDGPAIVKISSELKIKIISHDRNFRTIIDCNQSLEEGKDFSYWGTIAYVLKSEEEDFLDMVGQELFIIT